MPSLVRHLPQHRPWLVALSLIMAAVVIAACGWGGYLLVEDGNAVVGAQPIPVPTIQKRDISSRTVDPTPLTTEDVFPDSQITVDPSVPAYQRVGKPQQDKDCRVAATSDLGKLLVSLGCNQVIRATYVSTERSYLVTTGIFNLVDAGSAAKADTDIKTLVDNGKGRFSGYVSAPEAKVIGRSSTKLAWDAQGHFLLYSVIARADGKEFGDNDDQHVRVIVYDIVEKYLRDGVIVAWSTDRTSPTSPATSAAGAATAATGVIGLHGRAT